MYSHMQRLTYQPFLLPPLFWLEFLFCFVASFSILTYSFPSQMTIVCAVILCRWCSTWLRLCDLHVIGAGLPGGVGHHRRMETGHYLHGSLHGCRLCAVGSLYKPLAWPSAVGTSRVGHRCSGNGPQCGRRKRDHALCWSDCVGHWAWAADHHWTVVHRWGVPGGEPWQSSHHAGSVHSHRRLLVVLYRWLLGVHVMGMAAQVHVRALLAPSSSYCLC